MTPLKALREIARCGPPVVDTWFCAICKNVTRTRATGHEPHKDFCPWRQMTQIVAILEALEDDETVYVWKERNVGPVTRGFLKARELMAAGKE